MLILGLYWVIGSISQLVKIGTSGSAFSYTVNSLYLAGGLALIYFGYRQEYPPAVIPTITTGGRSRWF